MKTLTEQLAQYAAYHRDKRNIATHFVGIPIIVFAVMVLLSRPAFSLLDLPVTPALVAAVLSCLYYLKLDRQYGVLMSCLFALGLWAAAGVAAGSTSYWLAMGLGSFVVGWLVQFIGHYYEGKKPAFVDDLMGLIIGPLFVVAEAGFMLGLRKDLEQAIEAKVGPTLLRSGRSTV